MDAIKLHDQIVTRYKDYIGSFIDIRDSDIANKVAEELKTGKLWPDPLIQFNPAYEQATSIDTLVKEGVLHEELGKVFAGFRLHSHQEAALRHGPSRNSFVVTSGTGSGKSLTYIGTIFNALFTSGYGQGTKALIVYPMNALINSQVEELKKFAKNYKEASGKEFPIRFAAYTGQTEDAEREEIVRNPPDILLTNYMMLELLMTRHGEANLRESIFKSLEFLAFDELHTYRGRQGADVSYLIRRIRAAASKPLMAMGTSATMSSKGSHQEKQIAVSEVASKIFGESIPPERIIGERLERSLAWPGHLPKPEQLLQSINDGIDSSAPLEHLKSHPTAIWLENQVALTEADHGLERGSPTTLKDAAEELAKASGCDTRSAAEHLTLLLAWIAEVNQRSSKSSTMQSNKRSKRQKTNGSDTRRGTSLPPWRSSNKSWPSFHPTATTAKFPPMSPCSNAPFFESTGKRTESPNPSPRASKSRSINYRRKWSGIWSGPGRA